MSTEDEKRNIVKMSSGLGNTVPFKIKNTPIISPEDTQDIIERVRNSLATCATKRDILEHEVNNLAECISISTEIYKSNPVPDNAYQISALMNAYNSSLSQLEKMKDPKETMADIESIIKEIFTGIIRTMALEIENTKKEWNIRFPDERATIEQNFKKMLDAIQPETQKIYENLVPKLKNALGIRK